MNLKVQQCQLQLSEIRTVKYQLLLHQHAIIFIGYSTQSLKKNQYIYEVHHLHHCYKICSGIISIFGINFLTGYVKYGEGAFINLISQSGRKIIQLNYFDKKIKNQIVKSIDFKQYQLKSTKEKYGLTTYLNKIILVQMTQNLPLTNILIRTFCDGQQSDIFRIICFDPIPTLFFHKGNSYIINQSQITLFNEKLQPQYKEFNNWQNISVRAIHEELIITYSGNQDIYFAMTFDGKVYPLIQDVKAFISKQKYLYFITDSDQNGKQMIVMGYDKLKSTFIIKEELKLPNGIKFELLVEEWIKIDMEGALDPQKKFLIISS